MAKPNKTVSINVFHILKSVMDSKAKKLSHTISAGQAAQSEKDVLHTHIANLESYISANRYDRESAREAEDELADYEAQVRGVEEKIAAGKAAATQMPAVISFNRTYEYAIRKSKERPSDLTSLYARRDEVLDQLWRLDDAIAACEINMNARAYGRDVHDQACIDYESYCQKYNELQQELDRLNRTLSY